MIGVVADDVTGANDIGIMFTNAGYIADVYAYDQIEAGQLAAQGQPDTLILDTNSRCDPPSTAYDKVFAATRALLRYDVNRYIKKTCSVFRGNVGVEFDAMLDALHEEFAVVVVGFPKTGRTTRDGIHYVHGKRLEDAEFRHDPTHPTLQSDLVRILQSQTARKVARIGYDVIDQGAEALRAELEKMRRECSYCILDVIDQQSLRIIARAVREQRVLCGSSALAEELPAIWTWPTPVGRLAPAMPPIDNHTIGVVCAAGSLTPQTAAQIAYLQRSGVASLELQTVHLFDRVGRTEEIVRLSTQAMTVVRGGADVLIHSVNAPAVMDQVRAEGELRGLSTIEVARLVSSTLAEIVARICHGTGARRLLIAGGEVSAAVCRRLDIVGMRVYQEISPGLPSCIALSEPPLLLVLKSGSFGSPDFFAQAIAHLKAAGELSD